MELIYVLWTFASSANSSWDSPSLPRFRRIACPKLTRENLVVFSTPRFYYLEHDQFTDDPLQEVKVKHRKTPNYMPFSVRYLRLPLLRIFTFFHPGVFTIIHPPPGFAFRFLAVSFLRGNQQRQL